MLFRASPCGCEQEIGMTRSKGSHYCEHKNLFVYTKQLGTRADPATRSRSTLKRGKGFAVTPEQREKVRGLPCVGCGVEASEYLAIDPAHLYPRSECPCDHAEGVIPLCRTCHRIYDNPSKRASLDLLPKLTDRGQLAAFAHYITEHGYSPLTLLRHVTGQEWQALESPHQTREAAHTASDERSQS